MVLLNLYTFKILFLAISAYSDYNLCLAYDFIESEKNSVTYYLPPLKTNASTIQKYPIGDTSLLVSIPIGYILRCVTAGFLFTIELYHNLDSLLSGDLL